MLGRDLAQTNDKVSWSSASMWRVGSEIVLDKMICTNGSNGLVQWLQPKYLELLSETAYLLFNLGWKSDNVIIKGPH